MTTAPAPSLTAGTWAIGQVHSSVGFTVHRLMVGKVRGTLENFSAEITVVEDGTPSVQAEIAIDSVNTKNGKRDEDLKSGRFFEVEKYPVVTFRSTSVRANGNNHILTADLTLRGVTKTVEPELEFNGVNPGMGKGPIAGFKRALSSTVRISGSPSICPLTICPLKTAVWWSTTRSRSSLRSR